MNGKASQDFVLRYEGRDLTPQQTERIASALQGAFIREIGHFESKGRGQKHIPFDIEWLGIWIRDHGMERINEGMSLDVKERMM